MAAVLPNNRSTIKHRAVAETRARVPLKQAGMVDVSGAGDALSAMSTAMAAHGIVCDMVSAFAQEKSSGWADYGAVFLAAEVQDLIRARLDETHKHTRPDETHKTHKPDCEPESAVDTSWTIYCMDGATFSVAVPEDAQVAELKHAIGTLREVPCFTIELFFKDVEDALDDERRLRSVDKVPLFMLLKEMSDRLALEVLFKSTGGTDWGRKGGWMTDADLGDWDGVTVDEEGRVTKLGLQNNNLSGPCPSEIRQLSALQELDLGRNKISGPIPAELGQLTALHQISLFENQLTGAIPAELGQLGALTQLSLDSNQLTGPIPAHLGQLAALGVLRLDSNQLTGPIPAELEHLAVLTALFLNDNELTGPIPAELGQLGAMAELTLHGNQLTGQEAFRDFMEAHNPGCELDL
jgi:hypothetical protein